MSGRGGRRRLDAIPEDIVVPQGRNVRRRLMAEDDDDIEWNHPIHPLTEEERSRTIALKSTLLAKKSLQSYTASLIKFVIFVAEKDPRYLLPEFRRELNEQDSSEWSSFIRRYIRTEPKPPTSMFILPKIHEIFPDWLTSLKKKDKDGVITDVSTSLLNTCRSSVVWLFTQFNVSSTLFDSEASRTLTGLKISRALSVARGQKSVKRGKDPLSFEGYCNICSVLMKAKTVGALFTHAVLTTMWNLMSRVGNAVGICKSHLQWSDDALLIFFAHEKTDQTQSKPGDPRHIYANPHQPEICPILSLGLFFLVNDVTDNRCNFVFSGDNQYCRFHNGLSEFITEQMLGHKIDSFGTHSIRKGSATYTSSGSTSCPPFSAIANRAGWATGGVTNIYIQYQAAGDQYVGRTVSGLNPLDSSFATLPPRFRQSYNQDKVLDLLRSSFSRYDSASPELQKVLQMTTASVVYHTDWLIRNLEPDHCFFSTPFFRKGFDDPVDEMVECEVWKPGDVMKATGIPPHVMISLKTDVMAEQMTTFRDSISQSISQVVHDQNHAVPERAVTLDQIDRIVSRECQRIIDSIDERIHHPDENHDVHPVPDGSAALPSLYPSEKGRMTRLPENFKLPRGNLQTAWVCFCCWDKRNKIPPLRAVFGCEMKRKLASRFTRYIRLMKAIMNEAIRNGVWIEPHNEPEALHVLSSIELSNIIPYTTRQHRTRKRLDQLSWSTLANDYYFSQKILCHHEDQPDGQ